MYSLYTLMYTAFTFNVNSVYTEAMNTLHSSMAIARKAYHHGDLRESLLDAARDQLEAEGAAALSLRKLGRELGVTPGAPYRHFEDKDALLAALAAEGYRELRASMMSEQEGVADPEERLRRAGTGYVAFAIANPGLFRLMFGWSPSREIPELCEAGDAAFAAFESILIDCDREGLLSRPVSDAGLLAWSAVHGASYLLIDDRLKVDDPAPDTGCILNIMHGGIWSGIGRTR